MRSKRDGTPWGLVLLWDIPQGHRALPLTGHVLLIHGPWAGNPRSGDAPHPPAKWLPGKVRGRAGAAELRGPREGVPGAGLTVSRQVEDQVDHERDEHAGHQDVDDIEEWLAADNEVEGDVLAVRTVQRRTGVHVDPGWPVHYLPFPIL